jgi:hypothetical protein
LTGAIQAVLVSDDMTFQSLSATQKVIAELDQHLYDEHEVTIYKQHYLTLLSLDECLAADKLMSLPLILKLATKPTPWEEGKFLRIYSTFMQGLKQKGHIKQPNSEIV